MTQHAILLSASLLALAYPLAARAAPHSDPLVPACSGADDEKKGEKKDSSTPACECDGGKGEKK